MGVEHTLKTIAHRVRSYRDKIGIFGMRIGAIRW
jgi:hypothetical protein